MRYRFILSGLATLLIGAAPASDVTGPADKHVAPMLVDEGLPSSLNSAPVLARPDLEAWLDGYLPPALERDDIAGAVVVVVKDGRVLLQKGYGYADVTTRRPVDPERTLFRPGSVSKLLTWTAVMQQVELGRIDLDKDVNAYLDFHIPAYHGQPVTMRNLMTHTPGFADTLRDLVTFRPRDMPTLDRYLKDNLPDRIYPPGKIPAYSNYGVALAGYIVQRVSGEKYDDYMDRHIFGPLGMKFATFREPVPSALAGYMSRGYARASQGAKPYEMFAVRPAGSSAISGADMAKFMIAHLESGSYQGHSILRPETVRMMHGFRLTTINPALNRMALGFYEQNRNGKVVIGHQGDSVWFHSMLMLIPTEHVGIFISENSQGRDNAAWDLRTRLVTAFIDRYFGGKMVSADPLGPVTAKRDAALVSGQYESSMWMPDSFFSLVNLLGQTQFNADQYGRLSSPAVTGPDGVPIRFEEVGPFLWKAVGGQERLAARLENGKVVSLAPDRQAPAIVFLPTPFWRNSDWLLPALIVACGVLLLTFLSWPASSFARWRLDVHSPRQGPGANGYRLARSASGLSVLLMGAWFATVIYMATTFNVSSSYDGWIILLHVVSDLVFPLAVLLILRDVWTSWKSGGGWRALPSKAWKVLCGLSSLILLWVAIAYHLIGIASNF